MSAGFTTGGDEVVAAHTTTPHVICNAATIEKRIALQAWNDEIARS